MVVLVIAAHPDDEALGCGATILKHAEDQVHVLYMNFGRYEMEQTNKKKIEEACKKLNASPHWVWNFKDNAFDSHDLLDLVKVVEEQIALRKPEIIYTHHYGDVNIDHRRTYEAVQAAARPTKDCPVKKMLSFEIPSSTEWNFAHHVFKPNYFVEITDTINISIEALKCYESEMRLFPHPRSEEYIRSLARVRGGQSGYDYAQAFQIIYER